MTVRNVARKAGVSPASVSLALNGHPRVSPEMAEKVLTAARELGYSKKGRRTKSAPGIHTGYIGLLCVGLPAWSWRLPFFVNFVHSLESQLASHGLQMVLNQVPDPQVLPKNICARRMDGAFLIGSLHGPGTLAGLEELPTVRVFGCPQPGVDWVTTNASEHGRLAGEYLLGRGHQRLAFLNPDRVHEVFPEYGRSFQQTVAAHGVEALMLVEQQVYSDRSLWTREHYKKVTEKLLQAYFSLPAQERPTGMYVANDEVSLVAYQVLAENGVQPGVDLEIVSNDNEEPFLSLLTPRPATIEPDYEEIARLSLDRLLYRLQHPAAPIGLQLLVPPHLISPTGHTRSDAHSPNKSTTPVASDPLSSE